MRRQKSAAVGAWAVLAAMGSAGAAASPPDWACVFDFSGVTQMIENEVAARPTLTGCSLIISFEGRIVYERHFGVFTPQTVADLASATKLLSGVVIMSLVDDGTIGLDERISDYLPSYDQPVKRNMTFRQAFSLTGGMAGSGACLGDATTTLRQCADSIVDTDWQTGPFGAPVAPGTNFFYGGSSMHAAGAAAEVASGRSWNELFQQRLTGPLGLDSMEFAVIGDPASGPHDNPRIAGGARSTAREYMRVLDMLISGGEIDGVRILNEQSVAEMLADQTFGVPVASSPYSNWNRFDEVDYGIGLWRVKVHPDRPDMRLTSPGLFGTTPWLDTQRGVAGVFFVRQSNAVLRDFIADVQDEIERVVDRAGDINADGVADIEDLYAWIAAPVDVNGDGVVDNEDLRCLERFIRRNELRDMAAPQR